MYSDEAEKLLIVLLNSTRASSTSLYNNCSNTTPNLEYIADTGTVYTNAKASSSGMIPGIASLLTGIQSHQHNITRESEIQKNQTFLEKNETWNTTLITSHNRFAGHPTKLDQSFDSVLTPTNEYGDEYDTREIQDGPDGFWHADKFKQWMDSRSSDSWAACISLTDADRRYEPRDKYTTDSSEARKIQRELPELWEYVFHANNEPTWKLGALEQLYNDSIAQMDAVLGDIIDTLKQHSIFDETAIVVTSIRGSGFGEKPYVPKSTPPIGTLPSVHEAITHVPLVTKSVGQVQKETITDPVSITGIHDGIEKMVNGDIQPLDRPLPVVSSTHKPSVRHIEEAKTRGVDMDVFGPGRAAYFPATTIEPALTKYEQWRNNASVQTIYGNNATVIEGHIDPDVVDELFDDEQHPIGYRREDSDRIDESLIKFHQ